MKTSNGELDLFFPEGNDKTIMNEEQIKVNVYLYFKH